MLEEQVDEDPHKTMSCIGKALTPLDNLKLEDNIFLDPTNIGASMVGKAAVCPRWAYISHNSPFKISNMAMAKALRDYVVSRRKYAIRKLRRAKERRKEEVILGRHTLSGSELSDTYRILGSAENCHKGLNRLLQEFNAVFDKRVEYNGLSGRIHYLFWDDKEIVPVIVRAGKSWDNRVIRLGMQLKTSMYILSELVPLELNKGYIMFFSSDTKIPVYYSDAVKEDVLKLAGELRQALTSGELPDVVDYEICDSNYRDCDFRKKCLKGRYKSGPAQI